MMSDELKTVLKTLIIRMVDALGIWRDNADPTKFANPTWADKEMAIVGYMASRENVTVLIDTVQKILDDNPDITQFGFVTRAFISSTIGLIKDYRDVEFPIPVESSNAVEENVPSQVEETKDEAK